MSIYLSSNNLFAINENQIKDTMNLKINKATFILKNTSLSKIQKANQVFEILDEIFDYKLMAKITLGRVYKTLSTNEKDDFTKAYINKLKTSYMDKLSLYTDELTKINELKKVKKNRIILYTQLIGKENTIAINYKFYKNKQNQWFIYDVELLGTSIIQSDRIQFKNYLKEHTVSELIKKM